MEQHTTKKVSGEKRGRPSLSAEETAEQNRLRLSASFRTTMHHKAGSTLKKYSVLREFALGDELGRGGYATVFLATPIFHGDATEGDGIAGIDSLDMAVMGRGLSHALGDQPMSMSIDDIGFSERG